MRLVCLRFLFTLLATVSLGAEAAPASGYWWNPSEGGRGFVIEIQGSQMFMAGFLYAASGEATWVASAGAMTSTTQYSGSLITDSGGQTLFGKYNGAPTSTTTLGTISINFSSDTQATVVWPGGTLSIQRFDFGPGGSEATQPATNPQTGWWWNPNEGGRGFAIEVQGVAMYFAGYMYDASGTATWYLASGNMSSATLFQGEWMQYAGGQTLTGTYQAPSVANPNVAPVTLQFIDTNSAILTLPNEQISLARYNFGVSAPVLAAFSPSSAAPASLVTLSGSGINPAANLTLTLSDNMGYTVSVPLAAASATDAQVSVPPYYNVAAGAFGAGTLSMTLTQSYQGATATSNTLTGLQVQALPTVPGTGNATLALIQANLNEAQKLQTSIKGTAQDTPSVTAALAQQVTNMQNLVQSVQSVLNNGVSYTLGIVGGANITVTASNISQVDSYILATLQALAGSGSGSLQKTAQQAPSSSCLAAEATALIKALMSNSGNFTQFAQTLLEAPYNSAACNTAGTFTSAYQIFGGSSGSSIGLTNQAAATGSASAIGGVALFAAATTNADTALGINALIAPALANQTSEVQNGIGNVSLLIQPLANQVLSVTTGDFNSNVGLAQNLILTVAPPPSTTGPLAVSGNYAGTAYPTGAMCGSGGSNLVSLVATITAQGTTLTGTLVANGNGSDSTPTTLQVTGSYNAGSGTWSVSINGVNSKDETVAATGTIAGTLVSGTLTVTEPAQNTDCPNFVQDGVFSLSRQ